MTQPSSKPATIEGASKEGLFAITLFVEDIEAIKTYYQQVFGLPIVFQDPNSAVFQVGKTLLNFLVLSEAPELINPAKSASLEAGARFVFTLHVADVDATCAELAKRGVKLLNGPMDRPWGPRTASFMDPAGYIWEIADK